jgi:hypothetical protein
LFSSLFVPPCFDMNFTFYYTLLHIDCIKKQDVCHVKKDEMSIDDIIKE